MNWISKRMGPRQERGAVLPLAAVGLVLSMVAAALAVDLGRVAAEKRTDQKVADLAALDALRDFANMQTAAEASARRNGFIPDATHTITAIEGNIVGGNCQLATGSGRVCVTVTSPLENEFVSGNRTVRARAVASKRNLAGFTLGSGVASVNTKKSLLDPILGDMLDGTVNIASYQGLADSQLTLTALQTELAKLPGLNVGSPSQLLDADLTAAQLFTAMANAMVLKGDTANAAVFCKNNLAPLPVNCNAASLALAAHAAGTVKLRQLLNVAAGSEDAAVTSQFNVFQLLTGSAAVINGTNTVSIPSIGVTIPNVTGTSVSLKLIEKPQGYFGPVGVVTDPAHVTTSQADLTVNATLLNVLGLVSGTVKLQVTAGSADGWLTNIGCTNVPKSTTVHVEAHAATVTPTITLTLAGLNLGVSINSSAPGGTGDLTFSYPLYPNPSNPAQQSVGTPSLALTTTVTGTGNALVDALNATVIAALRPILQAIVTALDTTVIQPILDGLGINMGTADVKGLDPLFCGSPTLVG
ncbi:MAG TPA: pilus assembly protein TadG-related protein [Acidimicrobiales bacterium]|nr:pilus assembly protein TadG-related protein [Acidimicrobiales bacterium]